MATTKMQIVNNGDAEVKQKRGASGSSSPIRIKQKTKARLDQLLKKANKDRVGRKIKPDDILWFSLGLLNDNHIEEICTQSLSNRDRMELLFRKVSKERRGLTRDDFFGMLLDGKVTI
jgi:hypothetical protein